MVLHSSTPPVTLTLTLTPASALRQPLASSDALCCPVEAFLEESRYGASSFSIERGNASLITAYSLLACQGLWCYKGLDSGAMNLSTVFFSCRVSYRLRDSILFGFCKVFIEPDEHAPAAACLPLCRENTPPPSSCVRLPSNRGFGCCGFWKQALGQLVLRAMMEMRDDSLWTSGTIPAPPSHARTHAYAHAQTPTQSPHGLPSLYRRC